MAINSAPSFKVGDGIVTTAFGASISSGESVAIQADGKIVLGGNILGREGFALARYNPDGSLDLSFDGDGKATLRFGDGGYGYGTVIQPDGKILLGGQVWDRSTPWGGFGVARFNADGSLDTSFGNDGRALTGLGGAVYVRSLYLQPDGKILVGGGGSGAFVLVRYNGDGSLDAGFDDDGSAVTVMGDQTWAYSTTMQSDGKILLAGETSGDIALVRYATDGSLDTSFDSDGRVITSIGNFGDKGHSVAVQADGKILVAGVARGETAADSQFALVRYNADGSLDSGFGQGGKVTTVLAPTENSGQSVVIQHDGKILVGGMAGDSFGLARYNPDGSLDTSFGVDGIVITKIGSYGAGFSVALETDGKIVLGGGASVDSLFGYALARYNSDGSLDRRFDLEDTLGDTVVYGKGGAPVVLDPDVEIYDAELASVGHYGPATLTLAREGGADADDVFGSTGTLMTLVGGGLLKVDGKTIGVVLQNSNGVLALDFNGKATQSLVDSAIRQITYKNESGALGDVDIAWTFSDGNTGSQGTGGAKTATGHSTVTVTPNRPAVAVNDEVGTDEAEIISGSFFAANGGGADNDPDGDTFTVVSVNGQATDVGKQITLPSGALLTLNADGTFAYDPNHAFDYLPASDSGATNLLGKDSFRYAISGGSEATVTLTISGVDSNDRLLGTAGAAGSLQGGIGNDTYIVLNPTTTIVEIAGEGVDDVQTKVSFVLTADDDIESLTAIDTAATSALNLKGNALAQTITGNAGINRLDDGGGADTLTGLGGNDTYIARNSGTTIVEASGGGGADLVRATVSFALAADDDIEDLATANAATKAAIDLSGNGIAQQITGNAGANRLDGKGAADILTGNGGKDVFVFSTRPGGNVDRITDFNLADDTIEIENAIYVRLTAGSLAASAFKNLSLDAADADDRILYDQATGALFYDRDGSGSIYAPIQFAVIDNKVALTADDFVVV